MTEIDDSPKLIDATRPVPASASSDFPFSGKGAFAGPTASYPPKRPPRLLRDVLSFEKRCRPLSIRKPDRSDLSRRRLLRKKR
jgi:hypothetical protein